MGLKKKKDINESSSSDYEEEAIDQIRRIFSKKHLKETNFGEVRTTSDWFTW
jgi:hypothetical protein